MWKVLKFCSVGCTAHCAYRYVFPSGLSALKIRVIIWTNEASAQMQVKLRTLK